MLLSWRFVGFAASSAQHLGSQIARILVGLFLHHLGQLLADICQAVAYLLLRLLRSTTALLLLLRLFALAVTVLVVAILRRLRCQVFDVLLHLLLGLFVGLGLALLAFSLPRVA